MATSATPDSGSTAPRCPKCGAVLEEVQAAPGLAVDICRACGGSWLDKSEIYRFVQYPQALYVELKKAYESVQPSDFACPRCGRMLLQARLGAFDTVIEACPACGGIWADGGEMQKIRAEIARLAPAPAPAASASARSAAAPAPSAGGAPSPEGRPLTEMEKAAVFGVDPAAALSLVLAAGGAGSAAAYVVLAAMGKILGRAADLAVFLPCVLVPASLLFLLWRVRARRRDEAVLVPGAVAGVRNLASGPWGELELVVRYSYAGARHEVARRVSYRVFSDAAEGSTVGVVLHPSRPADGAVVRPG